MDSNDELGQAVLSQDNGEASNLKEHTRSLLEYILEIDEESLMTDLRIQCDDGIVQTYRVVFGCCSLLVKNCLLSLTDPDTDSLIVPGVTVSNVTNFLRCLYTFTPSLDQEQLCNIIKVLTALGVNVSPYVDISRTNDSINHFANKSKVQDNLFCDISDTNKGVIVIPPSLDVIQLGQKTRSQCVSKENSQIVNKTQSTNLDFDLARQNTILTGKQPEIKSKLVTTYSFDVNEKDEIVSGPKFQCVKCMQEFTQESDLEKHQKTDCCKRGFCEICNKVFSSSQTFSNHMKLHSKDLEFKCEICRKCFVSRSVLGNHMKTHDDSYKVARFDCPHCDKVFNHPSNLKRHIRTAHFEHSDKKLYSCPECGKSFKDPSARRHHLKIHLSVKPYPCEMCPKSFAAKSQLVSHLRIHTGEKPYLCNLCARCFVTKGQLKSHKLNRHVNIGIKHNKTHLCQECGQSFVKEYDLKVHMRKHTGERPFNCTECGKTFRSERNLVNHLRIHTGDKPYKCDTCGKGFASCAGLRQHFKCHANCRMQATEGAYCKQDRKTNRYGGRVQLESIPELSMDDAASLSNLENFNVSELKEENHGREETVVYFNTDSGLGIGIEGVTIQAIGLEMDEGGTGQVLSLVQIDEGMDTVLGGS